MYIENRIQRYLTEVLRHLPRKLRRKAEQEFRKKLYAAIRAKSGGRECSISELRDILNGEEFGPPEQYAKRWLDKHGSGDEPEEIKTVLFRLLAEWFPVLNKIDRQKLPKKIGKAVDIMFALAVVLLVLSGILAGLYGNQYAPVPFFSACVLGMISLAGKGALQET